ncbi:WYL domain-containing protein [Paenibacillus spiritus]|uniref:WYL domain-containing protein n=1 Tax=Paenibacillus spiritus TaxID=2496557 RepID=A0A5J5GA01_9BACL|nr:WYL domain-containing protein [Paenibacillus spiritus]KAA9004791.1 WYL domain-containing protein [Paenibacillus spiritus]
MTDRLIRLMRIITLVQAKPGILARELAERCGTSERTIYRDMDALSAMHIPITHLGHGKGYTFIGNFALYPLDWSVEEAAAFSQFSENLDAIKPYIPDSFESAYEKVLAAGYKYRADREERTENRKEGGPPLSGERGLSVQEVLPPALMAVLTAALKRRSIRAEYSEAAAEEAFFELEPYFVVYLEGQFHLVGRARPEGSVGSYPIQQLSQVRILSREFTPEPFNLDAFIREKWSLEPDSLRLAFRIRATPGLWKRLEADAEPFRPVRSDNESRMIHFEVEPERSNAFFNWISQFKEEAEIMEPYYYRELMKHQLEVWLSLYK